jgi:hypothetical protein
MKTTGQYFAVSFFAFFAAIAPSANAKYIATLNEVGPNVVGTGGGSFDVTNLTLVFTGPGQVSAIQAGNANLTLGLTTSSTVSDVYKGISGPTSFGGGWLFFPDSGSGNIAGVNGSALGGGNILVPPGYVSAMPLGISSATWNNATFASLGVIPGTYVWNWGSGIHADSFSLQIGPANGVPDSGSTIALLLGAIGTLAAFGSKLAARS